MFDVKGKRYLDFLSAYSAVNQGNCHPRILDALQKQAAKVTITTKSVPCNIVVQFETYLCEVFKYDKVVLMNSGAEAVEMAIKLARKWGYDVKKIDEDQASILFAENCYHGMLIGTTAALTFDHPKKKFGPHGGLRFEHVPFDNPEALEDMLKNNPTIAAFIVEPIQGEGIVYPKEGYLKKVRDICTKYNVLFVVDDVMMGLGRTGKLLTHQWEDVRPDMVILGKSLSGGFYPVSAVLADNEVMMTIQPGQLFSTFGGNSLGSAVGIAALEVLFDEDLIGNSERMGKYLVERLESLKRPSFKKVIGGKGLMVGVEIEERLLGRTTEIEGKLVENGVLTTIGGKVLRLWPALVVTKEQIDEAVGIVDQVFKSFEEEKNVE